MSVLLCKKNSKRGTKHKQTKERKFERIIIGNNVLKNEQVIYRNLNAIKKFFHSSQIQ